MSMTVMAEAIQIASAIIVSVVLTISGVSKLVGPSRTTNALINFGFSRSVSRWLAFLLPIVELVLVVGLVLGEELFYLASGLICVGLFCVFSLVLLRELHRGRSFDCGCFGAFSRTEFDRYTILRNITLLTFSVIAVSRWDRGESLAAALSEPDILPPVLVVVVVVIVFALLSLTAVRARRYANKLQTLVNAQANARYQSGSLLRVGDPVPDLEIVDEQSVVRTLSELARTRAHLIFFIKAGCGGCKAVVEQWNEWRSELEPNNVQMLAVTSSHPYSVSREYPELLGTVAYGASSARSAFGVRTLPAAVLLGGNDKVSTPVANGPEEINALVRGTVAAVHDARANLG